MSDMDFVVQRMCCNGWHVCDRVLHDLDDRVSYLIARGPHRKRDRVVVTLEGAMLSLDRETFVRRICWHVDFEVYWAGIVVRDDGGDPGDEC